MNGKKKVIKEFDCSYNKRKNKKITKNYLLPQIFKLLFLKNDDKI